MRFGEGLALDAFCWHEVVGVSTGAFTWVFGLGVFEDDVPVVDGGVVKPAEGRWRFEFVQALGDGVGVPGNRSPSEDPRRLRVDVLGVLAKTLPPRRTLSALVRLLESKDEGEGVDSGALPGSYPQTGSPESADLETGERRPYSVEIEVVSSRNQSGARGATST